MTRINLSQARLLGQIQLELLPSLTGAMHALEDADGLQTSPEIQRAIKVLREIIPRLRGYSSRREREFWNRIEHDGTHMIWLGEGALAPDGAPRCEWMGKRTTPARVAWLLITGETLEHGTRLRRVCTRVRCVSPGCHRKAASFTGRTTGIHADKDGNPTCRNGHRISRFPRPRETVYCKFCYQERKQNLDRRTVEPIVSLPGYVPTAPVYVTDNPEGAPLLLPARLAAQPQPQSASAGLAPGADSEFFAELAAMFDAEH